VAREISSIKVTSKAIATSAARANTTSRSASRRANAVKEYLVSLASSGGRIETISYGKEHPVCSESTEDCWAQNRRGVTAITAARTRKGCG